MKTFGFRFWLIFLLVYLVGMSIYFWNRQYYNWDIEAYMGIIYTMDEPGAPIKDIHEKVYTELRSEAPHIFEFPEIEEKTIGANQYYKTLSENPAAFGEELELFKVKPLYNWLNYTFYKLGFSASKATAVPVILSYILIILGIFVLICQQWKNGFIAFVFAVLISLFKPLQDATRHAAADMPAAALLLASFYCFFYRKDRVWFTVFAMLTVFTRPEMVLVFGIFLMLKLLLEKSAPMRQEIFFSLIFIAASFAAVQLTNQVSWGTLVTNQFIKVQYFPVSAPEEFDLNAYLNYLKGNILLEFNSSYFIILLLFVSVTCAVYYLKTKTWTASDYSRMILLTAIYLSVFLRFLIFPMLVNRMMVGFYLLIILTIIAQQRKLVSL